MLKRASIIPLQYSIREKKETVIKAGSPEGSLISKSTPDLRSSVQIFLRVLHKECYNGILQLRSSLCNTVQNVRQSGL